MLLLQTLVYCFIREIYSRNVFCVSSIGQTEGCYMLLSQFITDIFRGYLSKEHVLCLEHRSDRGLLLWFVFSLFFVTYVNVFSRFCMLLF